MKRMEKCLLKPNAEKKLKKWHEEYAKEFNAKVKQREATKREVEMKYQNFVLTY